jgi:hypothetical protein
MEIGKIIYEYDSSSITAKAPVVINKKTVSIPDYLWFKLPLAYADNIGSGNHDAFVTSLFLLASSFGEDIIVRGSISPRLLWGVKEYVNVFSYWFPHLYKKVDIQCESIEAIDSINPSIALTSFSGGVDSFFTIINNMSTIEPPIKIRYAIFVHGFDMPLAEIKTFDDCVSLYKTQLEEFDIKLIPASTNIREFLRPLNWATVHGAPLAGISFLFNGLFNTYFIPSTHEYDYVTPMGSDPRIVPLLATEGISVLLEGASLTRVEKTFYVSNFDFTYDSLRVCWVKPNGVMNCCQCEKCLRTMLELDLSGKLESYSTFPDKAFKEKVRRLWSKTKSQQSYFHDIAKKAKELGRYDVVALVNQTLGYSKIMSFLHYHPIMKKMHQLFGKGIGK